MEQAVAMLSSVLNSPRAIQVNVAIMRAFVRLRQMLSAHADLARKLEELERKYDKQFRVVFEALRALMNPPVPPCKQIGFHIREPRSLQGSLKKEMTPCWIKASWWRTWWSCWGWGCGASRGIRTLQDYSVVHRSYSSWIIFATLPASFIGGAFSSGNESRDLTVCSNRP